MLHDLWTFAKTLIKWAMALAAIGMVIAVIVGFALRNHEWPWDENAHAATTVDVNGGPAAVAGLLNADEQCDGYDREAFGDFTDETYAHVVARAAQRDQWTGQPLTPDDRPQVDHIVPVHEAFCSGLPQAAWTAFYNDADNLLLTAGKVNAGKSDKEPGQWAAPTFEAQCRFAATWVAVKTKWGLTADVDEVGRLNHIIQICEGAS